MGEHLSLLGEDQQPSVPVEEHIKPATLSIHRHKGNKTKMVAACATLGAVGGLGLLGPVSAVVIGALCGAAATDETTEAAFQRAQTMAENAAAEIEEFARRVDLTRSDTVAAAAIEEQQAEGDATVTAPDGSPQP